MACEDILEVPDISNGTVELLAPLDGTVIDQNTVSFSWSAVDEATNYVVQVATPSFANASQLVLDSIMVVDSTFTGTRISQTLLNDSYEWRVKARNSDFETPFSIAAFTLNGDADIDLIAPNTPVLVAPVDGSTQDDTSVDFSWTREDVSGTAERDSIYIYTDEALLNLDTKGLGANKTFSATLEVDTFFWTVRAFDDAGNASNVSEVFQFTIN